MISSYILRGLKYVLFACCCRALAMLGFVVKGLWNWLTPRSLDEINRLLASVGLIILSRFC